MKKLIAAGATVVAMGALAGPAAAVKVPNKLNVPPNCERGQMTAATNAAKRGNLAQAAKHTAKAAQCAAGLPPRSGGVGGIGK